MQIKLGLLVGKVSIHTLIPTAPHTTHHTPHRISEGVHETVYHESCCRLLVLISVTQVALVECSTLIVASIPCVVGREQLCE